MLIGLLASCGDATGDEKAKDADGFDSNLKEYPEEDTKFRLGNAIEPDLRFLKKDGSLFTGILVKRGGRGLAKETYKNGKQDGLTKWWYKDGTLHYQGYYKDGEKDGKDSWWWDNGQLNSEEHFKDGKRDGLTRYWDPDGKLTSESNYKDGKIVHQ